MGTNPSPINNRVDFFLSKTLFSRRCKLKRINSTEYLYYNMMKRKYLCLWLYTLPCTLIIRPGIVDIISKNNNNANRYYRTSQKDFMKSCLNFFLKDRLFNNYNKLFVFFIFVLRAFALILFQIERPQDWSF